MIRPPQVPQPNLHNPHNPHSTMTSRHSTPHHTTQAARTGSSENRALMEIHIRNLEGPQVRHVQRQSPDRTSQQERYDPPANRHPSTSRYSREPEKVPSSSHHAPRSKTRSPVPRSTPTRSVASRNSERQNQKHISPANHPPPTPRYSREQEPRPSSSHRVQSFKTRSPVSHSPPVPRASQNGERPTNDSRSHFISSSSDASDSSDGSGDTSHSEYIAGSESDSSADCADYEVDSSECAGNESDVSVVSAGTRREEAAAILQAAAQLQADAELEAAALQTEYDQADEELGRIRTSIARYKLKMKKVIFVCESNPWERLSHVE